VKKCENPLLFGESAKTTRENCKLRPKQWAANNVQKNVTDDRMMRIRPTHTRNPVKGRRDLGAVPLLVPESIKSLKADNKGPLGLKRAQQRREIEISQFVTPGSTASAE